MTVSVIINVFNGERFLREALDSVLAQTMPDFELLVVDDGSTDRTAEIVREYAHRDARVKLLQQGNQGIAAAMNHGLAQAGADWVAHLDADDRMHPERLARQMAFVRGHPEISVVATHATVVDATGKQIGFSERTIDSTLAVKELRPEAVLDIVHSSVLMSRQAVLDVGGYPNGLPGIEDRELWSRLATAGYQLSSMPELLTDYRLHGNSVTATKGKSMTKMGGYINLNFLRRAKGEPALSWQEFERMQTDRSRWERWREARESIAHLAYLNAARSYSERRWGRFVKFAVLSTGLRPIATVQRACTKLGVGRKVSKALS